MKSFFWPRGDQDEQQQQQKWVSQNPEDDMFPELNINFTKQEMLGSVKNNCTGPDATANRLSNSLETELIF